ncbi:lantibiotic dehydratase [Streptomyces morookaense]|uniref:lantibiotic dehydratase n=1 Tax=Streptomyces morookaense TaxID=1970 RepID=UPI0033C50347
MSRRAHPPLYRPLDWLMVRAPLLPVEDYLALAEDDHPPPPADPRVRLALAVGSGDLARALDRPPRNERARQRLSGKLLRYLIRMSTRPTPYGMFAGVGLGNWDDHTDLALAPGEPHTRTRPDMGWLLSLVTDLESRPEVRAGLNWYANPAVLTHAGRVFLTERGPVSLRATGAVRRVLALARTPVPHERLLAELMTTPGATKAKAERLIEQLWQHAVLLTDLRPPLTAEDPAGHVARRLAGIPKAYAEAANLTGLLDAMSTWDRLGTSGRALGYPQLIARARSTHSTTAGDTATGDAPAQVDMALTLTGRRVGRAVADEAARAAELLLRLSPAPMGGLDAYRRAFQARYGHGREVPLVELLDPGTGLGPPNHAHGGSGRLQSRGRILRDLALGAIRDRRPVVELDAAALGRLETWRPSPATAQISLDLSVFVAAASAAAVDAGDFLVVVGPNLGGSAAGRNLGRFADLIGPEAEAALTAAAEAEAAACPGRLWAEIVYQPGHPRSANVAIRPLVREHQVVLDTAPGPHAGRTIPLDELVVGVHDDRFLLRWPAAGREVVPCAGHMLNPWQAPAMVRFLDAVSRDGRGQIGPFDWGPAAGFPFLPRVQAGRVVLAPATWRIDAEAMPADSADAFAAAFATWRERWQTPRHIYLAAGDNRLLLDLDVPAQAEQLRAELRRLPAGGQLLLQEALPGPADAWLPGPDGRYISELVVPLVLAGAPQPAERPATAPASPARSMPPMARRLRAPGSDWLYAKLYGPPAFEEDLITGPVRDFCAEAVATGLATHWFFLRYSDPEPHLRIRLHGDPDRLAAALAPRLFRWGCALVEDGRCRRLCVDTYEREVERYGGPEAMALSEELFAVDSDAVAGLLRLAGLPDRILLAALTVDELLAAFGFDEAERLDWYRGQVPDRRAAGTAYRRLQGDLRSLLGEPGRPAGWQPDGGEAERVLARRRAGIQPLAHRLGELEARDALWCPRSQIAASHVHLHCNRLLGTGNPAERLVLGLLLRTRESLSHAPLSRRKADDSGPDQGAR